jgi:hypothetical protein
MQENSEKYQKPKALGEFVTSVAKYVYFYLWRKPGVIIMFPRKQIFRARYYKVFTYLIR